MCLDNGGITESKVRFKKINATCTPKGFLNLKQLLFFVLTPYLILTIFYLILMALRILWWKTTCNTF